jgi:hypothetical protein
MNLFDATGRQVLVSTMRGPMKLLDVSALKGLYTVLLTTADRWLTERIVIQ